MAQLHILRYPDPRLHTVAKPVAAVDERIRRLVDDMLETMYAADGVGLAATQVDVHERVIVIDTSEDRSEPRVLINPEIVARTGSSFMREGCMSVPDYTGDVERATSITVRYQDGAGTSCEIVATGFEAVAIQHELDHLDGLLFLDRIVSVKTGLFRRKSYK